ncbi:hypothetical protein D3C81_1916070 [compost metagenome]
MPLGIKSLDGLQFVAWQQVPLGLVDADLRGNGLRGVDVIAGEHQGFDTQVMQLQDGFTAGHFYRIGDGEQRQGAG